MRFNKGSLFLFIVISTATMILSARYVSLERGRGENHKNQYVPLDKKQGKVPNEFLYYTQFSQEQLIDYAYRGSWGDKIGAARVLALRESVKLEDKVNIITKALKIELQQSGENRVIPNGTKTAFGFLCPESECVKLHFEHALRDIGKAAIPLLKAKSKNHDLLSSEYKQRIVIALGLLQDETVLNDLSKLILEAKNGYIRSQSIWALQILTSYGKKKDNTKKIIPVLMKALKDPFYVYYRSDFMPGHFSPVRENIPSFLRDFGIKVERGGKNWNEFHVVR